MSLALPAKCYFSDLIKHLCYLYASSQQKKCSKLNNNSLTSTGLEASHSEPAQDSLLLLGCWLFWHFRSARCKSEIKLPNFLKAQVRHSTDGGTALPGKEVRTKLLNPAFSPQISPFDVAYSLPTVRFMRDGTGSRVCLSSKIFM